MPAVVTVATKQKSQEPADVDKRHKRMKANPDHVALVKVYVEKIAELENGAKVAREEASRVNAQMSEHGDCYRELSLQFRETRRLLETAAMLREEVRCQTGIREVYKTIISEQVQRACEAEIELEQMKMKRNPGRKGFATRGRPKKVVAKEVLSDDENAQPNLLENSVVESD